MKKSIEEIRKILNSIDTKYETDPNMAKEAEEYRKKYGSISWWDLHRPFTI